MTNTKEIKLIAVEKNYQDETTLYWFEIHGDEYMEYGITHCGTEKKMVDADNCPVNETDSCNVEIAEKLHKIVDNELVQEFLGKTYTHNESINSDEENEKYVWEKN